MDITKNPPPGDQGLAFQTHALQMILFGPFTCEPNTVTVRYKIVSLQIIIRKEVGLYFKICTILKVIKAFCGHKVTQTLRESMDMWL